jgi:hypothetical protein
VEKVKQLVTIIFLLLILFSCKTLTPIIIEDRPKIKLSETMTEEELNSALDKWGIDTISYIEKLINQIKNKVPYIDLKNKKEKNGKD